MVKPVAIKDVVGDVIQELSEGSGVSKPRIIEAVNSAVGRKAAGHIKTEYFKNSKLTINVDSSVWLYKLNMQRKQILDNLRIALPKTEFTEIIFKVGKV
ncbi:MAG: hypothetical protein COV72_04430 [Candidatus Omnitrophica bacterium CG11_big_fil_rev_8_21_14_0_20_42_13]|uniref:DUF721 domain-containing protein n=1 Tax=Candidatus Ghiorseimicrobium undicola TaxID=1974746 RepID=A0A2H0LXN7_9BACT|nr:MAG: hypothetical protein COV72_04430 [Candidatus Omnitrophica bacterium CG11_big_fil_rev_8_21_14_0_20_42_13]